MKETVLITGTSSGIGRAAAIYFAQKGWNVAATMRSPEKEQELQQYSNIKLYALDVTDNGSIERAIDAAIKDFGQLDVVVNNAGFGVDGIFEAMSDELIAQQFNTNVFGLMRVTRAAIPIMRKQGHGTIVQISSVGGRITFPLFSIYHGSKWAIEGFSESLQYELAPFNIRIRLVEPGAIKTDFYDRSRKFAKPTDTTVYDAFVEKCERVNKESGENGVLPEKVAHTIYQAATARGNRMRYAIAYPAIMVTLRRFLPDSWLMGMVRMSYKIG